MATTRDIHDIMGMGGGPVQKPSNKKKKKLVEASQPRLSGISREVQALMGDSVPPVQIVETPRYKSKPSLAAKLFKPKHWEERTFVPGARTDGLVLKHWKRARPSQRPFHQNGDVDMENAGEDNTTQPEHTFELEFPMEQWSISIKVPEYTDEQYERYYKADDWTREETDYLMQLAADYDLRWILIADRYDPLEIRVPTNASDSSTDLMKQYVPRTTEQLKLRYYQIAAQDLEMRTPKSTMNPSEFALFEKMRNFDAKTEAMRKAMAEKLFERTKEEAEEERSLLEELHRITKNEEDFINMRRDLYARLEAAPSLRRNERGEEQNIVLSSAGLSDLLSRLFAKEKLLKRRLPAPSENASQSQQNAPEGRGRSNTQTSRRDTIETPTENKKASISHPVPKTLTKAEEEKYGVSHPAERLTSGVSFRHEKINRVTTAKSQVQTQKINAALTELQIPNRLSMPTEKVCKEFERLVGHIQLLLDARKTFTRVSEEVKTLEEIKRQRLGEPSLAGESTNSLADQSTADTQATGTDLSQTNGLTQPTQTTDEDGEPGPAVDEDDDAEGEDDIEASNLDRTRIDDEEDEDQDETQAPDESVMPDDEDAENDEEEDDDDDDENEEQDEDSDDDDDEGMNALRVSMRNRDTNEDVSEDEEEDHPEPIVEEGDEEDDDEEEEEENDEAEDDNEDVTMNEVEPEEGDPDAVEPNIETSRPRSAGSRGHKRGASVVSDASGAGSNRSGIGRKRKR